LPHTIPPHTIPLYPSCLESDQLTGSFLRAGESQLPIPAPGFFANLLRFQFKSDSLSARFKSTPSQIVKASCAGSINADLNNIYYSFGSVQGTPDTSYGPLSFGFAMDSEPSVDGIINWTLNLEFPTAFVNAFLTSADSSGPFKFSFDIRNFSIRFTDGVQNNVPILFWESLTFGVGNPPISIMTSSQLPLILPVTRIYSYNENNNYESSFDIVALDGYFQPSSLVELIWVSNSVWSPPSDISISVYGIGPSQELGAIGSTISRDVSTLRVNFQIAVGNKLVSALRVIFTSVSTLFTQSPAPQVKLTDSISGISQTVLTQNSLVGLNTQFSLSLSDPQKNSPQFTNPNRRKAQNYPIWCVSGHSISH